MAEQSSQSGPQPPSGSSDPGPEKQQPEASSTSPVRHSYPAAELKDLRQALDEVESLALKALSLGQRLLAEWESRFGSLDRPSCPTCGAQRRKLGYGKKGYAPCPRGCPASD